MALMSRQWCILIVFALSYTFCACVVSIQAPFYPAEAEKKGATPTEYGLVFGVYNLGIFLLAPILGKYIGKLGPKFVFNSGIFTLGMSVFLFGFLDKIYGRVWFVSLSFAFRIVEALGSSAFLTSSFTIIACEFPDSVATTFASLETIWGTGLVIGPILGGALFELGGFILPFVVVGVSLFVTTILTFFLLPSTRDCKITDADGLEVEGYSIFKIIYKPAVSISAMAILMVSTNQGFLSATLEPLLRPFNFSPFQTGLMFMIVGGAYAISAPLWGILCDKFHHPKYVVVWACLFSFVSFLLIGPAPFLPFETTLWVTCLGLVINGIAMGAAQVAGFVLALQNCIENGFPDNVQTYGVVAAMWSSMLALGLFVGPSVGGFLLEHFKFRLASYFPLIVSFFVLLWAAVYVIMSGRQNNVESDDKEECGLLNDSISSSDDIDITDVKIRSTYGTMED